MSKKKEPKSVDPQLAAAADVKLPEATAVERPDELANVSDPNFIPPKCPDCGVSPLRFRHCVYEVQGEGEGIMEQWKILYCDRCFAPQFGAVIAMKRPEPKVNAPSRGPAIVGASHIPKNYPRPGR